ncbi:MAG: hypothetical protein AAF443_00010 [Chlamydiota bacterium]
MDPLSHAMLSDPKYAKQIEVQCYLVEREQLAELFANEKTQIIQKPNKELYQKKLFLLVRSRNRGNHVAFGTLKCLPPNCSSPIAVDLSRMWGHQTSFDDYVIYMGELILSSFADNELPNITYKWDCIYTM